MKRFLKTLLAVAMVSSVLSNCASATVLFEENFEGYPVGSSASDKFYALWGGWQVTAEGGNNFFRSVPYAWSDYLLNTSQQFHGDVAIEFMSRNTTQQIDVTLSSSLLGQPTVAGDWAVGFGINHNNYTLSYYWTSDGVNWSSDGVFGTFQGSADWSEWHDMKLTLTGNLVKPYIDGSFIGQQFDLGQLLPVPVNNFHFGWMTWGQRDIDNITVTAIPEPGTYAMMLAGLGLLGLAQRRRKAKLQ